MLNICHKNEHFLTLLILGVLYPLLFRRSLVVHRLRANASVIGNLTWLLSPKLTQIIGIFSRGLIGGEGGFCTKVSGERDLDKPGFLEKPGLLHHKKDKNLRSQV